MRGSMKTELWDWCPKGLCVCVCGVGWGESGRLGVAFFPPSSPSGPSEVDRWAPDSQLGALWNWYSCPLAFWGIWSCPSSPHIWDFTTRVCVCLVSGCAVRQCIPQVAFTKSHFKTLYLNAASNRKALNPHSQVSDCLLSVLIPFMQTAKQNWSEVSWRKAVLRTQVFVWCWLCVYVCMCVSGGWNWGWFTYLTACELMNGKTHTTCLFSPFLSPSPQHSDLSRPRCLSSLRVVSHVVSWV